MSRRFVIEAVMVAIYGQLLKPGRQVEYFIPYTTILELYDMKDGSEPVMPDEDEDRHVKEKIGELIEFFEIPLNRKKIERALMQPWRKSPPLIVNDEVTFTVINAVENAQYGEGFDPVETELILTSQREQAPIITDQYEFLDKIVEGDVPVQAYDIEDFEFAVEEGLTL